jgi:hypothetical protein
MAGIALTTCNGLERAQAPARAATSVVREAPALRLDRTIASVLGAPLYGVRGADLYRCTQTVDSAVLLARVDAHV